MKIKLLRASNTVREIEFAATLPPLEIQRPKVAIDQESRAVLKEMAAEWLKLAEAPVD